MQFAHDLLYVLTALQNLRLLALLEPQVKIHLCENEELEKQIFAKARVLFCNNVNNYCASTGVVYLLV